MWSTQKHQFQAMYLQDTICTPENYLFWRAQVVSLLRSQYVNGLCWWYIFLSISYQMALKKLDMSAAVYFNKVKSPFRALNINRSAPQTRRIHVLPIERAGWRLWFACWDGALSWYSNSGAWPKDRESQIGRICLLEIVLPSQATASPSSPRPNSRSPASPKPNNLSSPSNSSSGGGAPGRNNGGRRFCQLCNGAELIK